MSVKKKAVLYRMVTDQHICPYGIKSKYLLEREGYSVEDYHLTSREETDEFKDKHKVKTTPQIFIDDERVGGHDDLRKYLGKRVKGSKQTTYQPIVVIFTMTFLMAIATNWLMAATISPVAVMELFVAFSMCVLAVLKLRDLDSFSNQFLGYDLLARRYVPYAYIYPFAEAFAGIGMIAQVVMPVVALVALFIGTVGAVSVIKAVYIDKRDIKCACVGGNSNVPLGFVSLTENLMMIAMAFWMMLT